MKTDRNTDDPSRLLLTILALLIGPPARSLAQTGRFTYQGRLSDGGTPANSNYDVTFQLYDSSTGGNQGCASDSGSARKGTWY